MNKNEKGEFSYAPSDEKIAQDVQKLYSIYQERPVAVISYLYEKPVDRLKGFADAFKIKKD